MIPDERRQAVNRIARAAGCTEDAAYTLLLITAMLTDLNPADPETERIAVKSIGAGCA